MSTTETDNENRAYGGLSLVVNSTAATGQDLESGDLATGRRDWTQRESGPAWTDQRRGSHRPRYPALSHQIAAAPTTATTAATSGNAMSEAPRRMATVTRNASGPMGQSTASAILVGQAASVRHSATSAPAA
jgi:hypothetical protein